MLYDGVCDLAQVLGKPLTGTMPNNDTWVISSSGNHMFVSFNIDVIHSTQGIFAKIHFGNDFKNLSL